jgi:hypothetical protein
MTHTSARVLPGHTLPRAQNRKIGKRSRKIGEEGGEVARGGCGARGRGGGIARGGVCGARGKRRIRSVADGRGKLPILKKN